MLEVPSRAVSLLKHLRGCHMSFLSPLTRVSARALVISPLPQQLVSVCWCLWCVLVGQRGIEEGSCTLVQAAGTRAHCHPQGPGCCTQGRVALTT